MRLIQLDSKNGEILTFINNTDWDKKAVVNTVKQIDGLRLADFNLVVGSGDKYTKGFRTEIYGIIYNVFVEDELIVEQNQSQ